MPQRIQQRRTRGWRMPAGARSVARPSAYGNLWTIAGFGRAAALANFAMMLSRDIPADRDYAGWLGADFVHYPSDNTIRAELAGLDLACFCSLDLPSVPVVLRDQTFDVACHADILLIVANADPA
jgi:hypothetical protein